MKKLNRENIIGIAALLVHAAKIDQHYSDKEKDMIKNAGSRAAVVGMRRGGMDHLDHILDHAV